ncbi:MAG: polymer-forming cytoskeletal protein [Desulfobacterales bacterium]|nr:polymer-forming cytoskeletal protein [Desulfobacterales bacterium]
MADKEKNFSIIDKGLTVEGTVACTGRIVVKGTIKGMLESKTVIIAEEGAVYADAKVSGITIGGIFEGEVKASDELVILSSGTCSGKVVCKNLVIEAGGVLNAEVTCVRIQEAKPTKKFQNPLKLKSLKKEQSA